MDTKLLSFGLSANTGSSVVTSTATLTGTSVYGRAVSASTQVVQSVPEGRIEVTPDDEPMSYRAQNVQFTVSWENLPQNSVIGLAAHTDVPPQARAGITSVVPSAMSGVVVTTGTTGGTITIGSVRTGSDTVVVGVAENTSATRTLDAKITATVSGTATTTDFGTYKQAPKGTTQSVDVGSLVYQVNKSGGQTISYITFDSLTIAASGGGNVSSASANISNISANTSTTSSWGSPGYFTGEPGEALTATLSFRIPTDSGVDGSVVMWTDNGPFTGSASRPAPGEYEYTFNLGSIPSSGVDFGNVTVIVPLFKGAPSLLINGETDYSYTHNYEAFTTTFNVTRVGIDVSGLYMTTAGDITDASLNASKTELTVTAPQNDTSNAREGWIYLNGENVATGNSVIASLYLRQDYH